MNITWLDVRYSVALVGILFLMIFLHELGHYAEAKRQGIYKGWGLFPNFHIKLTQKYATRWSYTSGLWLSWTPFPIWLYIQSWVQYSTAWAYHVITWCFWVCWVVLAGADLAVVVLYNRLIEREEG